MGTETASQNRNASSVERKTVQVSASYNATLNDDVVLVAGAVAPVAIGLPPKTSLPWTGVDNGVTVTRGYTTAASLGTEIDVEDVDGARVVTITPADAQINGAASFVLPTQARAKCTYSPATGAWTANLYEPGGGGAVALLGDSVGPSGDNRVQQIRGDAVNAVTAQVSGNKIKQTQGGSLAVPADENPQQWQPRDPAKAAFGVNVTGTLFVATIDAVQRIGYNPDDSVIGAEPRAFEAIEQDYDDGLGGGHKLEYYWQISQNDASLGVRPIFVTYNRTTGVTSTVLGCRSGFVNGVDGATGHTFFAFSDSLQQRMLGGTLVEQLDGTKGLWLNGGATALSVGPAPPSGGYVRMSSGDGLTSINGAAHVVYLMFMNGEVCEIGHPVPAFTPAMFRIRAPIGQPAKGADLTNAAETITIAQGDWRVLPAATLTANRVKRVSSTGASDTEQLTITRYGIEAFTLTITDDTSGAVLYVFPALTSGSLKLQFDAAGGTGWHAREVGTAVSAMS